MSTTTADTRRPRLGIVAGIAVAAALALNTLGVFTEDAIHWANWLIVFGIVAVAAAVVFGWFVRRASGSATKAWLTGLVLAVLGLLTVGAFWSGLPPIFAGAALYLGYVAFRHGVTTTARRAGIVTIVLGALVLALDVVFYATDIATRI